MQVSGKKFAGDVLTEDGQLAAREGRFESIDESDAVRVPRVRRRLHDLARRPARVRDGAIGAPRFDERDHLRPQREDEMGIVLLGRHAGDITRFAPSIALVLRDGAARLRL